MVRSLMALTLRRVLTRLSGRNEHTTDPEIVVWCHQLQVFHRQIGRPRFRWSDRLFLAAASDHLTQGRRASRHSGLPSLLEPSRRLRERVAYRPGGGRPPGLSWRGQPEVSARPAASATGTRETEREIATTRTGSLDARSDGGRGASS